MPSEAIKNVYERPGPIVRHAEVWSYVPDVHWVTVTQVRRAPELGGWGVPQVEVHLCDLDMPEVVLLRDALEEAGRIVAAWEEEDNEQAA